VPICFAAGQVPDTIPSYDQQLVSGDISARREATAPTRSLPSNRQNVNKLLGSFIATG